MLFTMFYKKKFVILLLQMFQIFICHGQNSKTCTFSYKNDFTDKEPILLTKYDSEFKIYEPVTPEIVLNQDDELMIACPGLSNQIVGVNKVTTIAKCVEGKIIDINGTRKTFNKLSCDKKVVGEYLNTAEPCGKSGFKKFLGHKVGNKWQSILEVCYDQKSGETLYTKHTLHGAAIKYDKKTKADTIFKFGGLEFHINPDEIFVQPYLRKIFANLLGAKELAEKYINSQSTLVKAQLSPKNDFVLQNSQYASYFYINIFPQWKVINTGNWKSLENMIRNVASNLKEDLYIITGTYEILRFKNINKADVEIFLDDQLTFPVPKFAWKIVYSRSSKSGIAFVSYNNPFTKNVPSADYLCPNICDKYGWTNSNWKVIEKGIIYCCEVGKLMEKIKIIPPVGQINGILGAKPSNTEIAVKQSSLNCVLNYLTDFPEKEPILLKKVGPIYELVSFNENKIVLGSQEDIILLCPGSANKIKKINKVSAVAKCTAGTQMKINGRNFNFKDVGCSNRITMEYKLTREECSETGLTKYIGHKYDQKNFVTLISVCYNHKNGIPYYTEHVINGISVKTTRESDQSIEYSSAGLDFRVNVEDNYKISHQRQRFMEMLESKELAYQFINEYSFLTRALLSPADDFVFASSKYASYFYINAVPQWQVINNGNWKLLENKIRKVATESEETFEIITGTYDVLTLKNSDGKDVEIYLDVAKTHPVPKYIYKIIYSMETKKGIAFICYNDPFIGSITSNYYFCSNICKAHGWASPDWDRKDKGLVFCCEVNELFKIIPSLTEIENITEILDANVN